VGSYVIILAAVFALMWLLLIRPQRRKQLAQSRMQDSVEVGDDVLTAGGIHGTVREIEGEIVRETLGERKAAIIQDGLLALKQQQLEADVRSS